MPDPTAPIPDNLRAAAMSMFGPHLEAASAYSEMLATDGVVRGLIGPRETARLWDRHLLNCAAMAPLLPDGAYVVDVGSGAGLPGIVLAITRPDLTLVLVEPLSRRTSFLDEAVESLRLHGRVSVVRARAEEIAAKPAMFHVKPADVVTARAVAPLDRLAGWCLPLARVGGRVLAMKGSSASEEIATHAAEIARAGGGAPRIHECGVDVLEAPTTVVEIAKDRAVSATSASRHRSEPRSRSR